MRLTVIAALLVSACSSSERITLPAAELTAYADTDAVVVMSAHHSHLAPPGGILHDKGKDATTAMGDWTGELRGAGGDPLTLAIFILGLPVAAAIGAGLVHSEQEIAAADTALRDVAADEALFASLGERVAKRLRAAVPARWRCADTIAPEGHDPCPEAMRPASLAV